MKPSLQSQSLATAAVIEEIKGEEANQTLKDCWIQLGNQLEIDGVPKEKICSVAAELIITKKSERTKIPKQELRPSGYFYRVYGEQGWVNPTLGRPKSTEFTQGEIQDSSINTPEHNTVFIERLRLTRELVNLTIKKLEECEDLYTNFDNKMLDEYLTQWDIILSINKDAVDEKTKIPQNTEHILLHCLATESSLTHGAKLFMKTRVLLMEKIGKFLTVKQATKFQNGDKPRQLPLFQPDSRDTAIFLKYYGLPCPECNSWKVRNPSDSSDLRCIDCDCAFKGKTVSKCWHCQGPFYKEHLKDILRYANACPYCNKTIELPNELIEYAKS